jgi:hypothetical protein
VRCHPYPHARHIPHHIRVVRAGAESKETLPPSSPRSTASMSPATMRDAISVAAIRGRA